MALTMKPAWIVVLCVLMAARPSVSQEEDTELAEQDQREPCARWMRGVPGTPGFNGIPGWDGRDGREGEKGDHGVPGDLFTDC